MAEVLDHSPVVIDKFNGYWAKSHPTIRPYVTPQGYSWDCLNIRWSGEAIGSRQGIDFVQTLNAAIGTVVRMQLFVLTGVNRFLIMDVNGKLYDTGHAVPGTALYTGAAGDDFSAINLNNRAYITIHNRITGKVAEKIYVYDGTTFRAAAGVAPTTNPGAANGAAGTVEAGIHLIAFAWETASGFVTKYGLAVQYLAPGGLKINVTSVSNGGAGVVAKHILATKVIPNYDGNQNNYEFFFVPNGKINDNVTTNITIDFLDSQLVDSGDTLLDQLDTIPAGVFLCEHEGRLVSGGENGFESFARVSNPAKPESFSSIDGFIKCSPGDGGGLKNGRSFRGNLYLFKSNRTYATHDNGGSPSEWPISLIDGGIGAEAFSVADILDSKTFTRSMLFVLGRSGLQAFDGSYSQLPMSYNQDADLQLYFNDKSSLVANPVTKEIYVILDSHPSKYILMYNYADGLSYDRVRCSPWVFSSIGAGQNLAIKNIIIGVDGTMYLISSTVNEIYYLQYPMVVANLVNDDGVAIIAYYITHLVVADDGTEVHLALARIRAKSNLKASSNLIATIYDGETAGLAVTKAIPNVPMDEYDYPFNIVSRLGIGLKIGSTTLDHDWFVGRILLFMKKNAKAKPA